MNTFGRMFRLTDFGETHGKAIGGVIDGCPAGIMIDYDFIRCELSRRAPGQGTNTSSRTENDEVDFISGIIDSRTTGAPIGFMIKNEDVKPDPNVHVIKPSHASLTYRQKYGAPDNRFCGRASARQQACRVVAGAVAKLILKKYDIRIESSVIQTGNDDKNGDSYGAVVGCSILNLPPGLGEPVYDKFHARLGYAMLSINAAKGFEIGLGFEAASMRGSQYNDRLNHGLILKTNHDGGVQAGITNGEEVYCKIAFKPIPTINLEQESVDFEGNPLTFKGNSRNDRSVVPRVLPVVEAMAALVTVDFLLISKALHHEK